VRWGVESRRRSGSSLSLLGLLSHARLNPMRGYYLWGKNSAPPEALQLVGMGPHPPIEYARGSWGVGMVSEGADSLGRVRALGISRCEMRRRPGRNRSSQPRIYEPPPEPASALIDFTFLRSQVFPRQPRPQLR